MESEKNQIVIKQLPSISHQFEKAGVAVRKRISDLELDKQIVTEDTIQSIKKLRAELNKESAGFKEQVKTVLDEVEKPLGELKEKYKLHIEEPYKEADSLLKDKTGIFEFKIKKEKENNIKEYFDELVLSEKIDFLTFENVGLKIDLSTSEKKYKKQTNTFVMKVVDDLALIKATDYEAETLTEYKRELNVSKAITTVKTRKEAEAAEQAKIKAELIQNRKTALIKLGLNYVEITNSYEYNEEIFVSLNDVNNLLTPEFTDKFAEISAMIKAEKAKQLEVVETIESNIETAEKNSDATSGAVRNKAITAPISAPTVETPKEADVIAQFEVKATLTKLRALGVYMKENGIEYKNI